MPSTWELLDGEVPFEVRPPSLPEGWSAKPMKAVPGQAALVFVRSEDDASRMAISLIAGDADTSEHEHLDIGGVDVWWRYLNTEALPEQIRRDGVPRSMTSVVAQGDGFWVCGSSDDEPTVVAEIVACFIRR